MYVLAKDLHWHFSNMFYHLFIAERFAHVYKTLKTGTKQTCVNIIGNLYVYCSIELMFGVVCTTNFFFKDDDKLKEIVKLISLLILVLMPRYNEIAITQL